MTMELKPNFTPRAQEAIIGSRNIAEKFNKRMITENHLCLSVARTQSISIAEFYSACSIDPAKINTFIKNKLQKGANPPRNKSYFSSKFKELLNGAINQAKKFEHDYVGVEHILLSILNSEETLFCTFLKTEGIDLDQAKLAIRARFLVSEMEKEPSRARAETSIQSEVAGMAPSSQNANLLKYSINFNNLASEGKFDNVIGRDQEIKDMSEVLCRRSKNNPILLGEPGVGKTAVVEGLAQSIVNGNATDFLVNKTIYALDLAGMIAGTKYRGQFEERLKKVMEEISSDKSSILFIDEIHTLVGAGSAEGTMDAANILKPLLARGEIMCIGATTRGEYRKSILKDGALDRRFQPILVEEPSEQECLEILDGIKERYESFHGVTYSEDSILKAVKLSNRYILDRYLPDKAIDLLDQAGSKAKIRGFKRPEEAIKIEEEIAKLYKKEESSSEPHLIIKKREKLVEKYTSIIEDWANEAVKKKINVQKSDIYKVLTQKTGIPTEDLNQSDKERVLNLKCNLKKTVIGQDEAVDEISKSILRNKAGLNVESRPIGSFLFLGSSGVGKTYLAKKLCGLMFGGESSIIQLDMSEFSEKSSASKILGSAPGYVGYEEGGSIIEKIKKKPHSVVLFDEIEKADPEVTNLLLQILEEGKLTDSSGREASFRNSIIIITGNIGSSLTKKANQVGFGAKEVSSKEVKQSIIEESRKILKPELINRIESPIIFNNFSAKELKLIVKVELDCLSLRAEEKAGSLKFNPSVIDYISNKAATLNDGARPIRKIIKDEIENPLAEMLVKEEIDTSNLTSISYLKLKDQVKFRTSKQLKG